MPSATPSVTATVTITPTRTVSVTQTPTRSATPSATPSASATATQTRTITPTASLTATRSATASATATATQTQTGTPTATPSLTPTVTRTPTPTGTRTFTATRTNTSTRTGTATATETGTPLATSTRTPTRTTTGTRTPTATPQTIGAEITRFGVARADGLPVDPIGQLDNGVRIFARPRSGFIIYIEAQRGVSGLPVGTLTFDHDPNDPNVLPDLQVLVSRALGNGSPTVCDDGPIPEPIGGVPATMSEVFGGSQAVSDAINDLACRFDARGGSSLACTRNGFGDDGFIDPLSEVQFCTSPGVGSELAFPSGDTWVTARVLDVARQPGPPKSIIIRVP